MKNKNRSRNLVLVPLSSDYLFDFLTKDFTWKKEYRCVVGIPKDAVFIADYFDHERMRAMLVFYHPSFKEVPEGEHLPVLNVTYVMTSRPKIKNIVFSILSNLNFWWIENYPGKMISNATVRKLLHDLFEWSKK